MTIATALDTRSAVAGASISMNGIATGKVASTTSRNTASAASRKLLPGQWSGVFRNCLKAVGWPGDRPLSSHEFQARRAFGEVLDGLGRLDGLLGPLGFAEAVRRLAQLCRQRLFQPETRGNPAIQVLGVLESAGLSFDALWVMGMNDDLWPPPPRPNPLLPAEVLRAADLELDVLRRRVSRAGRRIDLTAKEFALLELFLRRQGEVLARSFIASQVWDMNFDSDTNVVEVAIRRLRAKVDDDFSPKLIHTLRGMGYVMEIR